MAKNPGKVPFTQPKHGSGKTTSKKNPGKVTFKQEGGAAGKTTSKKNPGKLGFTQKTASKTGSSTKKNPGTAKFDQPNRAGKSVAMPTYAEANVGKGANIKPAKDVAPKASAFKSVDDVLKFRKKKYGV